MTSLQEAVSGGQGIERPFRCHEHDDNQASASVNVAKGVWYCYACGAKGTIDGKKAPKVADLQAMLEGEAACRIYPEAYLELFANSLGNFGDRFEDPTRWALGLGCDPLTGDATFPVRSEHGRLAGVGRRKANPADDEPRYVYPPRWAASRSLFISRHPDDRVLLTVEGAADSGAVFASGFSALAAYGSGLHLPQLELIKRLKPALLVFAFDGDDAGEKGNKRAWGTLHRQYPTVTIWWNRFGVKDPDELPLPARAQAIEKTVVDAGYGHLIVPPQKRRKALVERYERFVEEEL